MDVGVRRRNYYTHPEEALLASYILVDTRSGALLIVDNPCSAGVAGIVGPVCTPIDVAYTVYAVQIVDVV